MAENTGLLIDEVLTGDGKVMYLAGKIVQAYYKLADICEDGDPTDKKYL